MHMEVFSVVLTDTCQSTSTFVVPAVEAFEEVSDSLCVPQYNKNGEERVILFLKMATNQNFSPDLVKRIREAIRFALSARHVPSLILETEGIPVRQGGPFCVYLNLFLFPPSSFAPWNSN